MLRLVSLSSGSCGNAIYIEAGKTKLLVDAGVSLAYIGKQLSALGVRIAELDAILLTHEHGDHIRSAGAVSRKYGTKVMANAATLDALPADFGRAELRVFPVGRRFQVGDFEVEAVPHSHDCSEPVGFVLRYQGKKVAVSTDLGKVTEPVEAALRDADIIVLESNHDFTMLARGRYPGRLKARVAGDKGHLSNLAAGRALAGIASGRQQKVLLAHLSDENNHPDVALSTVLSALSAAKVDSIKLNVARRLAPSVVVTA